MAWASKHPSPGSSHAHPLFFLLQHLPLRSCFGRHGQLASCAGYLGHGFININARIWLPSSSTPSFRVSATRHANTSVHSISKLAEFTAADPCVQRCFANGTAAQDASAEC